MALADIYEQAGVVPTSTGLQAGDASVAQGNANIANDYAAMANYYTGASATGTTETGAPANARGDYLVQGQYVAATPNPVSSTSTSITPNIAAVTNTGTTSTKTVSGTNVVTVNGQQQLITTYSDGTTSTTNLGSATNAASMAEGLLASYGITGSGIANGVASLIAAGLDSSTIQALLESPNPTQAISAIGLTGSAASSANSLISSWQTRFSGNTARIQAGLSPLDPATYIANEDAYKQVFAQAGMTNLSQDNAYIGQLMAKDVSAAEVQQRVGAAMTALTSEDPYVIQQLQSQFGLTQSDLAMHLLDPQYASNIIQQKVTAAQLGAEASRAGVSIAYDQNAVGPTGLTAMQLAAQGTTQAQATTGFQNIAMQQPSIQSIASRYGSTLGASDIGSALQAQQFQTTVNGISAAQAAAQLSRLQTQEISAFSGSAGAATGSLGAKDISGSL